MKYATKKHHFRSKLHIFSKVRDILRQTGNILAIKITHFITVM